MIVLSVSLQTQKEHFKQTRQGCRNRGAIGARAPFSIHQAVVNKLLSLTSLSVESDDAQLLHTLLVLECELNSMRYFDNSNISLMAN